MDYFVSSDAYHIDHDGSAHTRTRKRAQSNPQSNSQSNDIDGGTVGGGTDTDDFNNINTFKDDNDDGTIDDGFKDGYAQGWFTEPLVRMRSLGLSFDR